jgi:hypothetical protein
MPKVTVTIRGLDKELLRQAKASAARKGLLVSTWLNEAISNKLYEESLVVSELDEIAQKTGTKGVFAVPKGTIRVGEDYSIEGRRISAAGRKGNEEVVTYQTPSTIHNLGYSIFWIR